MTRQSLCPSILFLGTGSLLGAVFFFTWCFHSLAWGQLHPFLEAKFSEWLGVRTELGPVSFTWRSGIGVEVKELRLRRAVGEVPFLDTQSVFFLLEPWSIFRQKLVFYEFRFQKPQILFLKRGNGGTNWVRKSHLPKPNAGTGSDNVTKKAGGLTFLFSRIRIEDGSIYYRDERTQPFFEIGLDGVNATGEQSLPGWKVRLDGEGRLLSQSASDFEFTTEANPYTGEARYESRFQKDRVISKGELFLFQRPIRFRSLLRLRQMNLDALFQILRLPEEKRRIGGAVDGGFEIQGVFAQPEEFQSSLAGGGEIEIQDGAFRNLNLADSILKRITLLPALSELLTGVLPSSLRRTFKSENTPFEHLQITFAIRENQAIIQSLLLRNRRYVIQAEGAIGFKGELDFRGNLVLFEDLSRFLVGRVHELGALENPEGRLVIPFLYRGYWPSARPQPDLGVLAERLMIGQGARLVEKGLEFLSQLGNP